MTNAPERIVAAQTGIQPSDGSAGLWMDKTNHGGDGTEYLREDVVQTMVAAERKACADLVTKLADTEVGFRRMENAKLLDAASTAIRVRGETS